MEEITLFVDIRFIIGTIVSIALCIFLIVIHFIDKRDKKKGGW